MNYNYDFKIAEYEKLNLNKIQLSKKKIYLYLILILIIFFPLFFFFLLILKKINHIIKLNYNEKVINKKLFKKLDFKLQILEEKALSKEKKIIISNNINIYYLLSIKKVLGFKKIRIGRNSDGGYILLNDLNNIKIAYSFGISREISFEKGLADKNIDIFMYDHTIDKLPFNNSRFHWKKIGLIGKNINKNNMKTLTDLIEENGHTKEKNMILKLDIESYEWEVFQYLPFKNLRQFKYIVGEFHFSKSSKIHYNKILERLLVTHQIFHIHCNNCGRGRIIKLNGNLICSLLEISFIQKKGYKFTEDDNIYPIGGVDYKNCKRKKDISYLINLIKLNKYKID